MSACSSLSASRVQDTTMPLCILFILIDGLGGIFLSPVADIWDGVDGSGAGCLRISGESPVWGLDCIGAKES